MANLNDSFFAAPAYISPFRTRKTRAVEEVPEEMATPLVPKEGFTFGCDPECFIKDDNGKLVSAAGLIPGTKAAPHVMEDFGGVAIQVDGMAAEFNIPPASTFAEFNKSVDNAIKAITSVLPKGYSLDFSPSVVFDASVFENAPDSAKELGCTPDFNAWTGDVNPPPHDPENPYLRTASGHLHIGFPGAENVAPSDLQHILNCQDLVKQLDWHLGYWSLKLDPDPVRRKLYGKAGACRYKPYGVEYRVLSNFWVVSRERRLMVWNRMQQAIFDMQKSFIPERVNKSLSEQLVEAINTSTPNKILASSFRYPLQTIDRMYARV